MTPRDWPIWCVPGSKSVAPCWQKHCLARGQFLSMSLALENQIRGILKTFGRIVPKGGGGLFEKNVRALITEDAEIAAVIMPLLQARQMARSKCAALDRRLIRSVQGKRPVACS
jgi:transposase